MKVELKDGKKNLQVRVTGIVSEDFPATPILEISKLARPDAGWKGLRLDSALWAIQEKAGLTIWWEVDKGEAGLILPMESRNAMRFDTGIESPRIDKGWEGVVYLSSFHVKDEPKKFFLLLDFDKQ